MAYAARRFGVSLLIVFVVITISFFMIRLMPGNAIEYLYHQLLQSGTVSPQQALEQVQSLYGVNIHESLLQQYFLYMLGMVHGNLGNSILYPGSSVTQILANAIPWTVLTVSVSLLLSFFIGISIGTVMAFFQKHVSSTIVTFVMTVLNAIPNYFVALLLLYWFADLNHVFPTGGAYQAGVTPGWNWSYILSILSHAALPIIAYVITSIGGWSLGMKSSVVSVLGEEYITSARSHGIKNQRIVRSYVARNAILPLATSLGLSVGFMFGGSVFIESMFNYPGIGYYLVTAVNGRDYPLMMGAFILTTVAVVAANWLTDLMNRYLDPRSNETLS